MLSDLLKGLSLVLLSGPSNVAMRGCSSFWECSPERAKLSLESLLGCLYFATSGCGSGVSLTICDVAPWVHCLVPMGASLPWP